eukprot:Blabericola_migrator_1__2783@NODE_1797_length_3779_cov_47_214978_g1080_i2_p1_GENE_NODE_1797_length_3779_cov_47_214978_g1080_i2NODE_1797_length_3779_cov_47_214978_g1080_i2_p1_ORF_typecomplete_len1152_score258_55Inhibitor_I34/PF10466_9/0_061Retrotran_gag_2/PF14223_6/8_1Retrotran_gag_2/PF14223_6/1_1e02Retrotran_gag_2/PF14223_6/3e03_NODE_1797_length_3779_cov_47_214978_g1080_i22833738
MPSYNLTVSSSSMMDSKVVCLGLLCTVPTLSLSVADDEGVGAICSQATPDRKTIKKMRGSKLPCITDEAALDKFLENETGDVHVVKQADPDEASHILNMAIQSDPRIAAGIKMLEAQGVSYVIEMRRKHDLIKGSGDGALGVCDPEGIDVGSPLYTEARKNQASLSAIRDVDVEQGAAVGKLLTTLGNLVRISPDSPHKKQATHFKYFLDEVNEVLSHLKRTHAPEALLPCAVTAVFAKYKHECWDAVMRLAADDAAKDLQACADVLLDTQHVNNYLKFMEEAESTPPGPSSKAFNVAFGLLKAVDTETASAFRDLVVCLHDTVKPQVESLDKVRSLQVNEGVKDGEVESQVNQLNICIRNYLQTFYNIAQDFVRIERMSVPDKKAHQQAAMHDRLAGVSRKFWPALESCLKSLCDSTVVEDIKSKAQTLTKQLTAASIRASQLASDAESTTVKDLSSDSYWSRLYSLLGSLLGNQDGVKEEDSTKKPDGDNMSPMFADLLEIMEQLKTYGQVASASPEESPNVPDNIQPGDHVAICGALGFVSKPKAAAVFSYLRKLQSCLEFVNYRAIAKEEERASIEKFLNVDHHMMKAIQDEGHSFGVHGDTDPGHSDQIMTSIFDRYFKECWPHISAVLEGGDQKVSSEKLKEMASDISTWKAPGQEEFSESSQGYQNLKKLVPINVLWYLVGMSQFIKGAASEIWEWQPMTQQMWDEGFCPYFVGAGSATKVLPRFSNKLEWMLCLPQKTADNEIAYLNAGPEQAKYYYDHVDHTKQCDSQIPPIFVNKGMDLLYFKQDGSPDWARRAKEWNNVQNALVNQRDVMLDTVRSGIDISCHKAARYRWYDANSKVLKILCNEALDVALKKGPLVQDPYSIPRRRNKVASRRPLLADYEYRLVTGYPGPEFNSKEYKGKYQGFVICTDMATPTDEEVKKRVLDADALKNEPKARRYCRNKHFTFKTQNGRVSNYFTRTIKIFNSTVKIDRRGRIFVSNDDHAGRIGTCWNTIKQELEDLGFLQVKKLQNERKPRQTRDVSNVTQSDPITSEEIVEAFAKAEEEGLIKVDEYYGDFSDQWNDTDSPFGWTADPSALQLDGASFDPGKSMTSSEALLSYWPYVLGFAGTIGTIFTAKKVWDSFKTRPGKDYRQVTESVTPV